MPTRNNEPSALTFIGTNLVSSTESYLGTTPDPEMTTFLGLLVDNNANSYLGTYANPETNTFLGNEQSNPEINFVHQDVTDDSFSYMGDYPKFNDSWGCAKCSISNNESGGIFDDTFDDTFE